MKEKLGINALKMAIQMSANKLFCEAHPNVCELRDVNYQQLEKMVLETLRKTEEPISIDTALALVESALGEVANG